MGMLYFDFFVFCVDDVLWCVFAHHEQSPGPLLSQDNLSHSHGWRHCFGERSGVRSQGQSIIAVPWRPPLAQRGEIFVEMRGRDKAKRACLLERV